MASVTFSGVSSGIDFAKIVDGLMNAERAGVRRLEERKGVYESRNEALGRIEEKLSVLVTAAGTVGTRANLVEMTGQTSDENVSGVIAGSGALAGSYNITVNQLAAAEREIHGGVADTETLVGAGIFAYTYGTTTITVTTDATTTLAGLADLINNDGMNPGVRATLLNYDSGDGNAYHLVLSGQDTGADNTITIDDVQTTLDGTGGTVDFTSATFTEGQTARNAELRLDGYPAADWIERSSNTVTDLIDGVTLTLTGTGDATATVATDTESIKETINAFVTAYNDAIAAIEAETYYDAETEEAGILLGDYSVRLIRSQLEGWMIGRATGFEDGEDAFVLPGQIGIELDEDGLMTLDESTLDDALAQDFEAVVRLLSSNLTGVSDSQYVTYYGSSSMLTKAGVYDVEADFDGGGTVTAGRIRLSGESVWRAMTVDGNYLIGVSGNSEDSLAIRAIWDGASSTQSAEVRVRQGFAASLEDGLEGMMDSETGVLELEEGHNRSLIESIDDSIEREEARLAIIENRLTQQFSRLEALLSEMESLSASLSTEFASYNT